MGIEAVQTTVYLAKTKGRRYLSKNAAINAETLAIIAKKYPFEPFEMDTGHSFDPREMPEYPKMFRRMRKLVAKSF